jgi:hypothetical protein
MSTVKILMDDPKLKRPNSVRDRGLGMNRANGRWDLLNGGTTGAGGALASAWLLGVVFGGPKIPPSAQAGAIILRH